MKHFVHCCSQLHPNCRDWNSEFQEYWEADPLDGKFAERRWQLLKDLVNEFNQEACKIVEQIVASRFGGDTAATEPIPELPGFPHCFRVGNCVVKCWPSERLGRLQLMTSRAILMTEVPGLSVPLTSFMMYRGVAFSTQALVPLGPTPKVVYRGDGEADVKPNKFVHRSFKRVLDCLNLLADSVKEPDHQHKLERVEITEGLDGRYYFTNTIGLLPPTHPTLDNSPFRHFESLVLVDTPAAYSADRSHCSEMGVVFFFRQLPDILRGDSSGTSAVTSPSPTRSIVTPDSQSSPRSSIQINPVAGSSVSTELDRQRLVCAAMKKFGLSISLLGLVSQMAPEEESMSENLRSAALGLIAAEILARAAKSLLYVELHAMFMARNVVDVDKVVGKAIKALIGDDDARFKERLFQVIVRKFEIPNDHTLPIYTALLQVRQSKRKLLVDRFCELCGLTLHNNTTSDDGVPSPSKAPGPFCTWEPLMKKFSFLPTNLDEMTAHQLKNIVQPQRLMAFGMPRAAKLHIWAGEFAPGLQSFGQVCTDRKQRFGRGTVPFALATLQLCKAQVIDGKGDIASNQVKDAIAVLKKECGSTTNLSILARFESQFADVLLDNERYQLAEQHFRAALIALDSSLVDPLDATKATKKKKEKKKAKENLGFTLQPTGVYSQYLTLCSSLVDCYLLWVRAVELQQQQPKSTPANIERTLSNSSISHVALKPEEETAFADMPVPLSSTLLSSVKRLQSEGPEPNNDPVFAKFMARLGDALLHAQLFDEAISVLMIAVDLASNQVTLAEEADAFRWIRNENVTGAAQSVASALSGPKPMENSIDEARNRLAHVLSKAAYAHIAIDAAKHHKVIEKLLRRELEVAKELHGALSIPVAVTHNNLGTFFLRISSMDSALEEMTLAEEIFSHCLVQGQSASGNDVTDAVVSQYLSTCRRNIAWLHQRRRLRAGLLILRMYKRFKKRRETRMKNESLLEIKPKQSRPSSTASGRPPLSHSNSLLGPKSPKSHSTSFQDMAEIKERESTGGETPSEALSQTQPASPEEAKPLTPLNSSGKPPRPESGKKHAAEESTTKPKEAETKPKEAERESANPAAAADKDSTNKPSQSQEVKGQNSKKAPATPESKSPQSRSDVAGKFPPEAACAVLQRLGRSFIARKALGVRRAKLKPLRNAVLLLQRIGRGFLKSRKNLKRRRFMTRTSEMVLRFVYSFRSRRLVVSKHAKLIANAFSGWRARRKVFNMIEGKKSERNRNAVSRIVSQETTMRQIVINEERQSTRVLFEQLLAIRSRQRDERQTRLEREEKVRQIHKQKKMMIQDEGREREEIINHQSYSEALLRERERKARKDLLKRLKDFHRLNDEESRLYEQTKADAAFDAMSPTQRLVATRSSALKVVPKPPPKPPRHNKSNNPKWPPLEESAELDNFYEGFPVDDELLALAQEERLLHALYLAASERYEQLSFELETVTEERNNLRRKDAPPTSPLDAAASGGLGSKLGWLPDRSRPVPVPPRTARGSTRVLPNRISNASLSLSARTTTQLPALVASGSLGSSGEWAEAKKGSDLRTLRGYLQPHTRAVHRQR